MKTYVINLANSGDRRSFQQAQFGRLALSFEFFRAVTPADISDLDFDRLSQSWERTMSKGEVACFLSHRSLWKKVASAQQPALIMEDDAMLSEHTAHVLNNLAELNDVDRVNLEVRTKRKIVAMDSRQLGVDHRLMRLHLDRSGAAGYVLWPTGARKLLAYFDQRAAIADKALRFANLITFQVEPAVVVPADFCSVFGMPSPMRSQTTINPVQLRVRYTSIVRALRCKLRRCKTQIVDLRHYLRTLNGAQKRRLRVANEHFCHCAGRSQNLAEGGTGHSSVAAFTAPAQRVEIPAAPTAPTPMKGEGNVPPS